MAHSVRFFTDDAYPAARIADFVEECRECSEPALGFATPEHQGGITAVLERRGVHMARARDAHLLTFVDAEASAHSLVEKGRPNRAAFSDIIAASVGDAISRFGRVGA